MRCHLALQWALLWAEVGQGKWPVVSQAKATTAPLRASMTSFLAAYQGSLSVPFSAPSPGVGPALAP